MSEHYDFHYQPTGSGAISGQQVLKQTEDAINELGDYVNDNVGGAMDVAQQALETAQNAEQDAQTALDTANSFSSAIQSAQQDASTALSTAQTAQTTAIQAQQDASSAVTTANNASGQVSTLSGTVTALGQRVTTAEGNITTLQNDVSIAQGNASSAMATAGQVKQQAFVFRYSSTALVASSTNSNTLLDNTDNLKVGDKVIDSSGVLFSITAIDTANSTFTVGSALIDLALDANVVHTSGNETISGDKTFNNGARIYKSNSSENTPSFVLRTSKVSRGSTTDGGDSQSVMFNDRGDLLLASVRCTKVSNGTTQLKNIVNTTDTSDNIITCETQLSIAKNGDKSFVPSEESQINLGSSSYRWKSFNGVEPSSLSMPTDNASNIIDISSYMTVLDGSSVNTYQAPGNGYISITMNNCSGVQAYITGFWGNQIVRPTAGAVRFFMPICKNMTANILIFGGTIDNARFFPCQGNV